LVDARVDDRRDHEGDDADRLHDDERREPEARELQEDREAEHHGADDPRGTREQERDLLDAQARLRARSVTLLDEFDAPVLELRAEREEDRADEGDEDAENRNAA